MLVITLLILLFFSGFFSASETALTALGKLRIRALLEKEGEKAKGISLWASDPNRFLATILVGNNVANIGASVLATFIEGFIFHIISVYQIASVYFQGNPQDFWKESSGARYIYDGRGNQDTYRTGGRGRCS